MATVDPKEALTRKLGPLPAWGWGVAIGGAILVAKLLRGGSSASTPNAGYTPTTSGGGGMVGTGGDATPTDVFSGSNSLVEQLQEQVSDLSSSTEAQGGLISGLTDTVKTLTDFQALQTKLIDLLKQRDALNATLASAQNALSYYQEKKRNCKTTACKTDAQKHIDYNKTRIATVTKQTTTLTTQITDLQKQLNGANT